MGSVGSICYRVGRGPRVAFTFGVYPFRMENDQTEFPAPTAAQPGNLDLTGNAEWTVDAPGGAAGKFQVTDSLLFDGSSAVRLTVSGAGAVTLQAPAPVAVDDGTHLQLWALLPKPFSLDHAPELVLKFDGGKECSMGTLDFHGWHLLSRTLGDLEPRELNGIHLTGLLEREEFEVVLDGFRLDAGPGPASPEPAAPAAEGQSMSPTTEEEVATSIEQEDISFVFESRSLSTVLRFVYTPIEGNLSDIELEINSGNPIKPLADGGATIEMGGRNWSAEDEEIERHFVSCELVGDCVEARWQWKHGNERTDFLYRIRIEGKSLLVDCEGGNGRATGVSLGHVEDALTPKLIDVPYFNFGEEDVRVLATAGVFMSTYVDWLHTNASGLNGAPADAAAVTLNGGCTYLPLTDGKRNVLHERVIVTASRQFEEVLPAMPAPSTAVDQSALKPLVWYHLPPLDAAEEAYVEAYESLLNLKERGLDELLVLHPAGTWTDHGSTATVSTAAAPAKGGEDALSEYIDALGDLGYTFSLQTNFTAVSPVDPAWEPTAACLLSDGNMAPAGPGAYRLRPAAAAALASAATERIRNHFAAPAVEAVEVTAAPLLERLDCDSRNPAAARFQTALSAEQSLLRSASETGLTVAPGGNHWLYRGLCHGFTAPLTGNDPSRRPLLVDFALRFLHPFSAGAGLGSIDEFYGGKVPEDKKNADSSYLIRYLATTAAYGHAARLPEPITWGSAAAVKTYYMLQRLQSLCVGTGISQIHYHHDGNYLELTEALMSDVHTLSQLQIEFENGVRLNVNGGWEEDWTIEHEEREYRLPPGCFWAHSPDGLLVYSADAGEGYIDFAQCDDFVFIDTRGTQLSTGPVSLSGCALVQEHNWKIDILPFGECSEIEIEPAYFWVDRRLPRLRLLGFHSGDDDYETIESEITDKVVRFTPDEEIYKYRIALPEWMVEPGR